MPNQSIEQTHQNKSFHIPYGVTVAGHHATAANPATGFKPVADFEAAICAEAGVPASLIQQASAKARAAGLRISEFLIAEGWLDAQSYCRALASKCNFNFYGRSVPPVKALPATREPWRLLRNRRPLPLSGKRHEAAICAETFPAESLAAIAQALGPDCRKISLLSRTTLAASLAAAQGRHLMRQAVYGLTQRRPSESAQAGLWLWQSLTLIALTGGLLGAWVIAPRETLTLICFVFSLMFFLSIFLRGIAAAHVLSAAFWRRKKKSPRIPDSALPRYSVLVPLFRETAVLRNLIRSLMALDYPAAKLDIKLILEEADHETISAVRKLPLPGNIDVVVVPDSQPRTKPKALNYALQFATGDLVVVYDAEDRPEPDQLRRAAAAFRAAGPDVVCLQARLTYFNHSENWLAKQFTIEYAAQFDGMLPMFDRFRLPIPLGGTSNHFRIDALRHLAAWDAFNVTEDADLGMRLYRAGLRCEMLDSMTEEEACCQPGNWLRQRSRWLKGWMQTYGVHMREPVKLLRELGIPGFIAFQGHFAGTILSALAHPWFYLLLMADWWRGALLQQPESLIGMQFWGLSVFNFIAGYAASIMLGLAVLVARRDFRKIPQLFLIPIYWLWISAAAYRALYQLVKAPFYWDKTEHGRSGMAPQVGLHRSPGPT